MIVLVGEVAEITGNKDGKLVAQVIETAKEKRGPLVSVVVKQGTLRITDMLYFEGGEAKVRGLFSATGESVKEVLPGYPVQILGFSELPKVGSVLVDEQSATGEVQVKKNESQRKDFDLSIVLKAESAGSLEAVLESLPPGVVSLQSTVGELAESDVSFAKDAGCDVFVFESKVGTQVKRLADTEGVTIYEFAIIYELLDSLKEIVESGREKVLGEAEILKSFPYNDKIVAGSKVKKGSIAKGKVLVVMRGEVEVGRVKIASLKKNKLDVPAVSQGEEFGVILTPQLAFERGDVLLSVEN
jgi:translation initiation factor IF-2